jgi:hypothetical protein
MALLDEHLKETQKYAQIKCYQLMAVPTLPYGSESRASAEAGSLV